MKRPHRARPRALESLSAADAARVESLTVAMALAPGVYARNRMYELFANAGVKRAKSRAATLRGIVKHLGRASALRVEPGSTRELEYVLRYEIPALCLSRVVELSRVELATLRVLAARAGAPCMLPEDEDRVLVETALARLLLAGGDTGNLARAAQNTTTPSTPPPAE
jgi:hypothetical protein